MNAMAKSKKSAPVETVATIGEIAGKIWRYLNAEGSQTLAKLSKELGERPDRTAMALGWLAREDKVTITVKGNSTSVALRENASSW